MARHVNIPIFIPHEGCKNECVFCNQRTITGVERQNDDNVKNLIESALSTIEDDSEVEIAFFGGSFTGIGTERTTRLCDTAYEYVKQNKVRSIRLSTRPDYIDEEILTILKDRGVTHIELGIQSMSQHVLDACKRGHTTQDTEKACRLINDFGFILGGQMMIGLPCSDEKDELYTAKKIAELGCKESRIYPCVVFRNTELCNMATSGKYSPITIEQAVDRSAKVFSIFKDNNVKVLRIGLQSSENLSDEKEVYAGANHPALGELVMSRYFYYKIADFLSSIIDVTTIYGKVLIIECCDGDLSQVIGQKKENLTKIQIQAKQIGFSDVKIVPCANIGRKDLYIHF